MSATLATWKQNGAVEHIQYWVVTPGQSLVERDPQAGSPSIIQWLMVPSTQVIESNAPSESSGCIAVPSNVRYEHIYRTKSVTISSALKFVVLGVLIAVS
jgi:hypothetical protein